MTLLEKLRRAEFVIAGNIAVSRRSIQIKDGELLDDLLHEAAHEIQKYRALYGLVNRYLNGEPLVGDGDYGAK